MKFLSDGSLYSKESHTFCLVFAEYSRLSAFILTIKLLGSEMFWKIRHHYLGALCNGSSFCVSMFVCFFFLYQQTLQKYCTLSEIRWTYLMHVYKKVASVQTIKQCEGFATVMHIFVSVSRSNARESPNKLLHFKSRLCSVFFYQWLAVRSSLSTVCTCLPLGFIIPFLCA